MSSAPDYTLDPDEPNLKRSDVTNFKERLPDPGEIARWTGKPGVEYLMIDARNLHTARSEPPVLVEGKEYRWEICKEVPVYTVTGPLGEVTLMVLGRGKPIEGADPANGIRRWFYDKDLLLKTGIKTPFPKEAAHG